MNREEARQILQLCRPGTADADDPQIAEALALTKQDSQLSSWLENHFEQHELLRTKFRQIAPPAGLKEQIISEEGARRKKVSRRRALVFAAAAAVVLFAGFEVLRFQRQPSDNDVINYRARMVRVALTGYAMDLETNDMAQIRAFLAKQHAPADYVLPPGLEKAVLTGCAVQKWNGRPVAMICFRTGRPTAPGTTSDLWLFVAERGAVENLPETRVPALEKVNRLLTATWTDGNKVYLLGVAGNEETIRPFL